MVIHVVLRQRILGRESRSLAVLALERSVVHVFRCDVYLQLVSGTMRLLAYTAGCHCSSGFLWMCAKWIQSVKFHKMQIIADYSARQSTSMKVK